MQIHDKRARPARQNDSRMTARHGSTAWFLALWLGAISVTWAAAPPHGAEVGGGPEERFQSALMQEEGLRNYEAAIREYEGVIAALDEQRRLAASAVYRLGECFRKLGRTNEAVAQYERLLAEFAGEESLARLSRQNLAGLGWRQGAGTAAGPGSGKENRSAWADEGTMLSRDALGAALRAVDARKGDPEAQARVVLGFFPDEGLRRMLLHLSRLRRQREDLPSGSTNAPAQFVVAWSPDVVGRDVVFAGGGGDPKWDRERAEEEWRKQLALLQDRVDFLIGIQRTRWAVLGGGVSSPGVGVADPSGLLARQIEAVRQAATMGAAVKAAREFFGATASGLDQLWKQLGAQEQTLLQRKAMFSDEHPETRSAQESKQLLERRLEQELADVLSAQEARLKILQSESPGTGAPSGAGGGNLGAGGPGAGERAPTSEEAEEIRKIEALVANSPDLVNALDGTGSAPLHKAAGKGQLVVARYLLDHGARTQTASRDGYLPLHSAVMAGHKAMVELLLDRGAEVNARASSNPNVTALHLAAQRGFVAIGELLVARGADVQRIAPPSQQSGYDGTPLYVAVMARRAEFARLLLDKGADPNRCGEGKNPPLSVAATEEMVALLLEHRADPNADGGLRLVNAAAQNEAGVVRRLLDAGARLDAEPAMAKPPRTALYAAVAGGHRSLAEELVKRGADLNRISRGVGGSPFHRLVTERDLAWLRWALERGGDPNRRDAQRQTPLELTGFHRSPVLGPESAGAEGGGSDTIPGAVAPVPMPAIHPLALGRAGGGVPEVNSRLGSEKADNEPVMVPTLPWRRAELLLRAGARADEPMVYAGASALHIVALQGGTNELAWLLPGRPNLEVRAEGGITPLILAAAKVRMEMVEALIRAGADVNATNEQGNTALHYAAILVQPRLAERLLAAKADPALVDIHGRTAARLAEEGLRAAGVGSFGLPNLAPPTSNYAFAGLPPGPRSQIAPDLAAIRRLLPASPGPASASASTPTPRRARPVLRAGKVIVFGAMQAVVTLEANKATTLTEALVPLPKSPTANLRKVKLHRAPEVEGQEGTVETLDVEALLRSPNREQDPVLQVGDRIEVTERVL